MSNNQTIEIERFAGMFGALSNPARLTILLRLVSCCGSTGTCSTDGGMGACVGEIAAGLDLAPSTVSHHLKELRRAGLISMTRQGRRVRCEIDTGSVAELVDLIDLNHRPKPSGT